MDARSGSILRWFDDINFERHPYDPWAAYSQSKTANILFMVEAARRWEPDQIAVNALNPGRITATNLSRYLGEDSSAPAALEPNCTTVVEVGGAGRGHLGGCRIGAGVRFL